VTIDEIMRRARLWRAGEAPAEAGLPTGFPALDAALPAGGWPFPGLIEILSGHPGSGALRLVLPALAQLAQTRRWLIWVAPPYQPYAPALQAAGIDLSRVMIVDVDDTQAVVPGGRLARGTASASGGGQVLWAFEQALRFAGCGAGLLWPGALETLTLRRLQLACVAGGTLGVLFRASEFAKQPSPAALRLLLTPQPGADALDITILKCRGGVRARECRVAL
jgi:cell division inhibitor SulA/protein ImuA